MQRITSLERNVIPKYWLISDRNNGGTGRNVSGPTYFVSDGAGPLNNIARWRRVTPDPHNDDSRSNVKQISDLTLSENRTVLRTTSRGRRML